MRGLRVHCCQRLCAQCSITCALLISSLRLIAKLKLVLDTSQGSKSKYHEKLLGNINDEDKYHHKYVCIVCTALATTMRLILVLSINYYATLILLRPKTYFSSSVHRIQVFSVPELEGEEKP